MHKKSQSTRKSVLNLNWFVVTLGLCLAAQPVAADCVSAVGGLLGWWPGDGNANNVFGTNNGILQGGATANATGLVGLAFNFDGTNGSVQIPDSPLLRPTNLTVEAWVKFASLDSAGSGGSPSGDQYIVFRQNTRNSDFEGFDLSKTRVGSTDVFRFLLASASGQTVEIHSSTTINTSAWYHVAAVRGSNFVQLYVNGALERQTNITFPQDYGNFPLYFGTSGQAFWDHKLKGNLDEVSLYDRALSSNDVAAIFLSGSAGKCKAPIITVQPQSQTVPAGTDVTFIVSATGFSPLSYQWRSNSVSLAGATNSSLTLLNVQPAESADYTVVVANILGSTTSAVATLTVQAIPAQIFLQPTNQVALFGSAATFTAAAIGSLPLVFHWQKGGVDLVDGERLSGVTTPSLTISNIQIGDIGNYRLIASNAYGTDSSAVANLAVVPIAIWGDYGPTSPPATLTNAITISGQGDEGDRLNLCLKSDGTVAGWGDYHDQFGYHIFSQADVPSDATNLLAVSAGVRHGLALKDDGSIVAFGDNNFDESNIPFGLGPLVGISAGAAYSLVLKSNGTPAAWGIQIILPNGLTNLVAISAGLFHSLGIKNDGTVLSWNYYGTGQTGPPAGLSNVVAVSAGGHHSLALKSDGTVVAWGLNDFGQCDVPPTLSNVVAIAAGFSHSLALKNDGTVAAWGNNATGQASPPAGLSNVVGIAAGETHSVALLGSPTAAVLPSVWWQGSTNRLLVAGQSTLLLPSVTGSMPMNFQWYLNDAPLSGQISPWLTLASAQPNQSGDYKFVVSNSAGSVTSSVVSISIGFPPLITQQPVSQANLIGSTAQFTTTITGTGPLALHWYQNSTVLFDDSRHFGTTTPTLTISNLTVADAGNYTLTVTSAFGSVTSAPAALTVIVPPTITTQPRGYSVPIGLPVTFSAAASGLAPPTYQWLLNGVPVQNATNASLTISNLSASDFGNYQVVATNLGGATTSSIAPLTVGTVATWGTSFGTLSSTPMWPPPGLSNVIAVAGNNEYSLALKLDGTVFGWARSFGAPTNIPGGLSGIVAIAGGVSHALALRSNGSVVAWGSSGTATNVPATLSNVVAVAAGTSHSLALRSDGTVVAWGTGIPTTNVPAGLIGVANIDGGASQSLALRSNGTVTVWGIASDQSPFPFGLPRLVNVAAISAGQIHNMVARNDGTIAVWGGQSVTNIPPGLNDIIGVEALGGGRIKAVSLALRSNGRVVAFGDNSTGMTNVPAGLSNVVALAGGFYHALALINDGRPLLLHPPVGGTFYSGNDLVLKAKVVGSPQLTFTWSKDGSVLQGATSESLVIPSAQLSDSGTYQLVASNALGVAQSVPVPVTVIDSGPILMSQPATRYAYQGSPWSVGASVIGSGPMQFTWSQNSATTATGTNELLFDAGLPAHSGAYQLVANNSFGSVTSSVAQITFSRVAIWGTGVSLSNAPIDLGTVRDVVSAYYHVLAIKSDGTVAAWGTTLNGATNVPPGLSNVVAVAGGKYFSLALRSNGTAIAWGVNNVGQTNVPPSATNLVAIAAGGNHVLALRADGRVIAWGDNSDGATTVPFGALSNVVAIAAGQFHSAALRDDGTAIAWGSTAVNPANATNLVALSAGFSQTFGLRRDGTVITWMQGNEPVPPYLSNVVALASGGSVAQNYGHDFALIADGTPIGWGNNFSSQLNFPAELTSIIKITCGAAQTVALLNDRTPVVTVQPWDRRVKSGNIAFTAFAVGQPPLTYQWHFDGANIPGATNPTLSLTAVNRGSNGLYSATIFNNLNHADSRSAKLDIGGPLRLVNPTVSPDGLFTLTAEDPLAPLTPSDLPFFGVLASTNLIDWETLQTSLVLTNGTLLLQDPSPTNYPIRFYRIVEH